MADQPATLDAIYQLYELLRQEKVPIAFIGGVALNTWAVPRATFDLDIAIAIEADRVSSLLRRAESAGFVVDAGFHAGFRDRVGGMEKVHFFLPAGKSLLAVDLFFAETPFLRSVIARRTSVDLGRGPVPVCTAADLLLFKLLAGRNKDLVDVDNLLVVQGVPERSYLETWAKQLQIEERLRPYLNRSY